MLNSKLATLSSYPKKMFRTRFFALVLVLLAPAILQAQSTSPQSAPQEPPQAPSQTAWFLNQAGLYGNGEQLPLRYEGEKAAVNLFSLSVGASAFYDDNVLGTNNPRLDDEALSFDSRLALSRQTEHVNFNIDYLPFFLVYRQINQYDRINHAGNSNLAFRLGSHFILGMHDSAAYENGVFQTLSGEGISSGTGTSAGLNQTVLAPAARELSNASSLDLTYLRSERTILTLFGTFDRRDFGSQVASGQGFYNGKIASGGVQYQYRITEHVNLGLLYSYQDSRFLGYTVSLGGNSRYVDNSAVVSLAWHATPTVTLSAFGTPHYVQAYLYSTGTTNGQGRVYGGGGGVLTKQVKRTAVEFSGERILSDGGGLLTYATSTNADIGVRRQVVGRWEARLQVGAARTDALLGEYSGAKLDSLQGNLIVQRPLFQGLTMRLGYEAEHQLSKGSIPLGATFDRNRVTCSIDYQLKAIQFGR